jgi:hypothetical protein
LSMGSLVDGKMDEAHCGHACPWYNRLIVALGQLVSENGDR